MIDSKATDGPTHKAVRYTYSPDGERFERIEDGESTRFLVDSNREHAVVIAELVNGVVRVEYVRPLTGEAAIAMIRDGQTFTLYTTLLGTTKLVTSASGIVTDRIVVDPFGAVVARTGMTVGLPVYNGEFRDGVTGYDYLRARFYVPQIGRFVSMDPFTGWHDVPISLNKYLYAHSDPVNGRDPSGMSLTVETVVSIGMTSMFAGVGAYWGWSSAIREHYQSNNVIFPLTFAQELRIAGPRAVFGGAVGGLTGFGLSRIMLWLIEIPTGASTAAGSQGAYSYSGFHVIDHIAELIKNSSKY